jgi:hypothetical protein
VASFLVPLSSVLLGAAIAIASSIFIERYRDRRSALAAALVIRDSLRHLIVYLTGSIEFATPFGLKEARRYLSIWDRHNAILARSFSPSDWQEVARAFSSFDVATLVDDPSTHPVPPPSEWYSVVLPGILDELKLALVLLERRFSLSPTYVPRDISEMPVTIYAEPDHRVIARVAANARLERPDSLDSPLAV